MQAPFLHRALCVTGDAMARAFYAKVEHCGEDVIPSTGPIVIACSHHNQMVDVCVLSRRFPFKRMHRYWAKASLFKNSVFRYILLNSGNIPVDRRNNDNQVLLRGSFEVLAQGEVLALFPEGTSYTEPRILQVRDGISWTILEYAKYRESTAPNAQAPLVVPIGIVYVDKTQYRTSAVIRYGNPMNVADLEHEFLTGDEPAKRQAIKTLSSRIEQAMTELTINAPDWTTLYAATIARQLLWGDDSLIRLADFVHVSQTIVDTFSREGEIGTTDLKRQLVSYYSLLDVTRIGHAHLHYLFPLDALRGRQGLPSKGRALFVLTSCLISSLARLPLFAVPLLVHWPVYLAALWGQQFAGDEVEARAQMKIVFGLLGQIVVYPILTGLFLARTGLGAWRSIAATAVISYMHRKLITTNYNAFKRLRVAWKIFRAVWSPQSSSLPIKELKPFLTPVPPPPNPFVKSLGDAAADPLRAHQQPPSPPPHRLIRHLLQSRLETVDALNTYLLRLQRTENLRVGASAHLARQYGDGPRIDNATAEPTPHGVGPTPIATSSRSAGEVLSFLRARGGHIPSLQSPSSST